jgi:hypothetical protein
VKTQRKDFASKKDFLCRYPAFGGHLADLAVTSARSHSGPTGYPAVGARWPAFVAIRPTATVDRIRRPEAAMRGANVGLAESISATSRFTEAVGLQHEARFHETSTS